MADWAITNADDLRLDLYIPPELEFNRVKPNEEERWELVDAKRESQLQEALREVFHDTERKHLLVMDEAGAGKTITSLRIQKLLSEKESSQEIFPDAQRRLVERLPCQRLCSPRGFAPALGSAACTRFADAMIIWVRRTEN